MTTGFSVVSRSRVVLAAALATLGVVLNYGSTITSLSEAAWFSAIALAVGYLVFTVLGLLSDRFWWDF